VKEGLQSENPAQAESQKLNSFFQRCWDNYVERYPEFASFLGLKMKNDQLDDISDDFLEKEMKNSKLELDTLALFDTTLLNPTDLLSYQLFRESRQHSIHMYKYRHYNYPISQYDGFHSNFPTLMLSVHAIDSVTDALAYIQRLKGATDKFNRLIENIEVRAKEGIIPPKFVFSYLYSDCENLLTGKTGEHIFYQDFISKIDSIKISPEMKTNLLKEVVRAIEHSVKPAYRKLLGCLKELEKKSTTDDGVWKFPDGNNFYNAILEDHTTVKMTADEIHELGLKEVATIHSEMKEIMKRVGWEGDLTSFFNFLRTDKQFYYDQNEQGKESIINDFTSIINNMKMRLDEFFILKPKADLEVKPVEAFKEASVSEAYYEEGATNGSRPGIFRINTYRMNDLPSYENEALSYHEGIPGHHTQLSLAQEMVGLPEFRKHSSYSAYIEGWGLYCEHFPKEYGFYKDPYSDFGRLSMKLWRACRLVVDTGIHRKKWTRKKAIDYLLENTPSTEGICTKAIERYIVNPGQACAYMIGMLKILELREYAKHKLGTKFDIRKFHDRFLSSGAVPLTISEQWVGEWVEKGGN